ncbi:MAG: hypothetical protein U0992_02530 [Planctomycetaceae bacterium]
MGKFGEAADEFEVSLTNSGHPQAAENREAYARRRLSPIPVFT